MQKSIENPTIAICYEPPAANCAADMQDILVQAEFLQRYLPYEMKLVPYTGDVSAFIDSLKGVDIAWNLFETFNRYEEQQYLGAALLELARVPYTGTKAAELAFCADKRVVRAILTEAQIKVPRGHAIGHQPGNLSGRWILKPAKVHGSLGISDLSVVSGEVLGDIMTKGDLLDIFAEQYIDGDEYSVALLEQDKHMQAVAVAQMQFINYPAGKPRILSYDAKWNEACADYAQTVRSFDVDIILATKLAKTAEKAAKALGLAGFARVDFRVSEKQEIYVIDVNPNPGLGEDSGFIAACIHADMSKEGCLEAIVKAAH